LAEEKKDVIVPSAGNEKLQPEGTFGTVKKEMEKSVSPETISKFKSSAPAEEKKVTAAEAKLKELKDWQNSPNKDPNGPKWRAMDMATGVEIPIVEKKDHVYQPPKHYKGIKSSGVNDRIKNSSFGRGVPFSGSADHSAMWKHTSRLASAAIGDGCPDFSKIGLTHGIMPPTGTTISPFTWDGAIPLMPTVAIGKGTVGTFHTMQDEDE
jgi:hypothetical protein